MLDFGILVIWLAFSYDVKISPTKWENYVGYLRAFAQNLRHPLLTTWVINLSVDSDFTWHVKEEVLTTFGRPISLGDASAQQAGNVPQA